MGFWSRFGFRLAGGLRDIFTPKVRKGKNVFKYAGSRIKIQYLNNQNRLCVKAQKLFECSEGVDGLVKLPKDIKKDASIFWHTIDGKQHGKVVIKNQDNRRVYLGRGLFNKPLKPGTIVLLRYLNDMSRERHNIPCEVDQSGTIMLPLDCPTTACISWTCCDSPASKPQTKLITKGHNEIIFPIDCGHEGATRTGGEKGTQLPLTGQRGVSKTITETLANIHQASNTGREILDELHHASDNIHCAASQVGGMAQELGAISNNIFYSSHELRNIVTQLQTTVQDLKSASGTGGEGPASVSPSPWSVEEAIQRSRARETGTGAGGSSTGALIDSNEDGTGTGTGVGSTNVLIGGTSSSTGALIDSNEDGTGTGTGVGSISGIVMSRVSEFEARGGRGHSSSGVYYRRIFRLGGRGGVSGGPGEDVVQNYARVINQLQGRLGSQQDVPFIDGRQQSETSETGSGEGEE